MIRGGLRSRLIIDSVRFAVISTLQQRGWFDPTIFDSPPGVRRHQPLSYISRPVEWSKPVTSNSVAITAEDIYDEPIGFGRDEVEDRFEIYVDVFAQDDPLGWQVAYDIRDSLMGKNPELGSLGPQIDVYDFRQPTPAPFTTVDIAEIRVDRSEGEAREWHRHWFMVYFAVEDDYSDEYTNEFSQPSPWTATQQNAWAYIQEVEQKVP
jgi:hypothetical protein